MKCVRCACECVFEFKSLHVVCEREGDCSKVMNPS